MRELRVIPFAVAALAVVAALVPVSAAAQVEVGVSAAGRKVVHNENAVQRGRRLSTRLVEPPREDLLPRIEHHARSRGLDPRLVRAVVQAESGYNPLALSTKGAQGLMQLMPETARELAVEAPFDPDQNLRGGTEYLRRMLERFGGRVEWALAAYNAGPGAVERFGGVPPYRETLEYVDRVLALWHGAPDAPPVRFAAWPPSGEAGPSGLPAAPALRPAAAGGLPPARPVGWRREGGRLHLTNIDR